MSSWFEPDYLENFHCKAGKCRHTCCRGWEIQISEYEYFRLIGMECSEELHEKLETAFAVPENPSEEAFRVIKPNWLGDCPMLTDQGLCLLQQECGAQVLPDICRLYPRSFRKEGNCQRAVCSGSCEAVVQMLMSLSRLNFHLQENKEPPEIIESVDKDYPAVCLRCLSLIQDRSMAISKRIASIAHFLGCSENVTPETVRAMLPTLLEISPELRPYLREQSATDLENQPWAENLLANHMLYVDFPYTDRRISKADSIIGMTVCYELLKMVSANCGDELTDALTAVFHLTEHTSFYYNTKLLYERQ